MRMNSAEGKSILALVRDGSYAHAGEEESIESVFSSVPKDSGRTLLDAGWGTVSGFDIDSRTIELARQRHPALDFVESDVGSVGRIWQAEFDLIYSFNAFYAFPDSRLALENLAVVARPNAQYLIFDYTDPFRRYAASPFARREDASFWHPIHSEDFSALAISTGWRLESSSDMTSDYHRWYGDLLRRIEVRSEAIVFRFGQTWYDFVLAFYTSLYQAIEDGTIGGGLFRLRRQ
jgi:SAM-dependent methyltransferase